MDITKYVSALLFDYECVVIPGLGGFIVNDRPATVNRINHQFKPPFRTVMFNVHLKANDGLLVNHIVTAEGVSYHQVRRAVDLFVNEVREVLDNGGMFTFEKLGSLRFDRDRNVVFEQDATVNYNPDAYGLAGFVSPPVRRVSEEEKLRSIISPKKPATRKPSDRKPETVATKNKKKKVLTPVLLVMAVLILLAGAGWGLLNPGQLQFYWENTAALIPAAYHGASVSQSGNIVNQARYIPRALIESDKEIMAKLEALEKNTDEVTAEAPVPEKTMAVEEVTSETIQPAGNPSDNIKQLPPEVEQSGPLYYIIAGSFSDAENAGRLVDDLRRKGYRSQIADTNSNGMYRVAYAGIKNLHEAKQVLFAIRQEDNAEAWLFRK